MGAVSRRAAVPAPFPSSGVDPTCAVPSTRRLNLGPREPTLGVDAGATEAYTPAP